MEAITYLVPKLQSEIHSGCGTQLFEKTQCFYVATVNFNVPYTIVSRKFACVFVKKAAWKLAKTANTTVVKVGSHIVSMDRKTSVYGIK